MLHSDYVAEDGSIHHDHDSSTSKVCNIFKAKADAAKGVMHYNKQKKKQSLYPEEPFKPVI